MTTIADIRSGDSLLTCRTAAARFRIARRRSDALPELPPAERLDMGSLGRNEPVPKWKNRGGTLRASSEVSSGGP